MGDEKIQIVATAKDNASPTIKTLQRNVSALGSKTGGPLGGMIGGFAGIAGPALAAGAAIGLATEFLGKGIKSAIEEEKSLGRLTTALDNNVPAWEGHRDEIDANTKSMMRLGFEDDATRDSMGKLVAATKDVDEAMRLQGLAANIARGRNIELSAATDLVLKANMGNVGALRRAGIEIDANADKTEILAKLNETYAGQAEEYANSTEGAMESAQIAIDEVAETLGESLLPILKDAAIWLRDDIAPGFEAMADNIDRLPIKKALDLAGAIGGIPDKIKDATGGFDFFKPFGDALSLVGHINPAVGMIDFMVDSFNGAGEDAADAFADSFTKGLPDDVLGGEGRRKAQAVAAAMEEENRNQARTYHQIGSFMASEIAERYKTTAAHKYPLVGRSSSRDLMDGLVDGIRGNKDFVEQVMKDVMFAVKHPMKTTRELARIEGALTQIEYQMGLNKDKEGVINILKQQKEMLIIQWEGIAGTAYNWGLKTVNAFMRGLRTLPRGFKFSPTGRTGNPLGGNDERRAAGGDVAPGQTVWVGERGPELFTGGRRGGSVTPSHKSGGGPIHVVSYRELRRILDQDQGRELALAPG